MGTLHFGGDGFADFVAENEGRLVSHFQIARERQGRLTFDLIAVDRDGREIGAQRKLMESEQRPRGERE